MISQKVLVAAKPYKHWGLSKKKAPRFCEALGERRRIRTFDRLLRREVLYPAELCAHYKFKEFTMLKYFLYTQSGWQDSNLRPPRPKRGAMTGLRYTPSKRIDKIAERKGFEPPVPVKVQLLSREPRSATPAPLLDFSICILICKRT